MMIIWLTLLRAGDDCLGTHAPRFGCKVYALPGALGNVASGISHERDAAFDSAGTRVLRNGVSLHANDLAALCFALRAVTGGLLILLDACLVHHSPGSCTNVRSYF